MTLKQVIEGQSQSNGAERHENDTERIQGGELVDCKAVLSGEPRVAIGANVAPYTL